MMIPLGRMIDEWRTLRGGLGWLDALKFFLSRRKLAWLLPHRTFQVRVRGCPAPVHLRHGTSDKDKYVLYEVLLKQQYACIGPMQDIRWIVDARANIGTASIWFLNRYPAATVISLEPDPDNYAVLQQNLAYYGERAVPIRKALWHAREPLRIVRGVYRDGREWSHQVQACDEPSQREVEGLAIPDLCSQFGIPQIDILKIDIEGAERYLFECDTAAWLSQVRTIAIELHDEDSRRQFFAATLRVAGRTEECGEVTVWHRDCENSEREYHA